MALIYEDCPAALDSAAFASFLETLYGRGLRLDDSLIEEDVEALEAFAAYALGERAGEGRILDSGCGTGDLLRRLCRATGARGVGIDPSPVCVGQRVDIGLAASGGLFSKALAVAPPGSGLLSRAVSVSASMARAGGLYRRALSSAAARRDGGAGRKAAERLEEDGLLFLATSIEEAKGVEGEFDFIVAIDSLGECADMRLAVDRLLSFLAPAGTMLIAHTERVAPGDPSLGFSRTSLAAALKGRGLFIRGRDISRSEKLHWKLGNRLLDSLKEGCAKEGNEALYVLAAERAEAMTASVERDDFKRYWYCVRKKRQIPFG
jgi:SAM-dependent methyltransferase